MIRATAGQSIGAQMVSAVNGSAYTGVVDVYVTVDAGVQAIGSVAGGVCVHEGNGYHSYMPSIAEVSGELIAFTFIGTGAIPATIQVFTTAGGSATDADTGGTDGGRTYSGLDLVTRSLRLLGVLPEGAMAAAEEAANGLDVLNDWIDAVGIDRALIADLTPTTHPLTMGKADYTIGPGGELDRARPSWIDGWSIVPDRTAAPVIELSRGPAHTMIDYQQIVTKSTAGSYPSTIFYDNASMLGLGRIYLYPVPNTSTADLKLYVPRPVAQFANLSTLYAFPPSWARAIRYNLAVELAAEYPSFPASDAVQRIAMSSLAAIRRLNYQATVCSYEGMAAGRYDIYSDSYVRGRRG